MQLQWVDLYTFENTPALVPTHAFWSLPNMGNSTTTIQQYGVRRDRVLVILEAKLFQIPDSSGDRMPADVTSQIADAITSWPCTFAVYEATGFALPETLIVTSMSCGKLRQKVFRYVPGQPFYATMDDLAPRSPRKASLNTNLPHLLPPSPCLWPSSNRRLPWSLVFAVAAAPRVFPPVPLQLPSNLACSHSR